MSFNTTKYKVMHIGSRNSNHTYHMGAEPLQEVQEGKDLEVTISSDLRQTKHCKTACNKANTMLGFIGKNLEYKTPEVMLTLLSFASMVTSGIHRTILDPQLQERY